MEGVGARLGRSSTRYGPATVFTGPVRKWKKEWIPLTPLNSNSINNHHHQTAANGNNGSHLLLYKWTPITTSQSNGNGDGNGKSNGDNYEESRNSGENDAVASNEPPKRKFKYMPVAVLEEQKNEASQVEDESKPMETETDGVEPTSKSDGFDEKPDINDVPAEESQALQSDPLGRQDLNESTLDLSLGLKAHDGDTDSDSK